MSNTNSEILCPVLAEEQIIISSENVNSLLLSNYERSAGTEVTVTCLSSTHALTGGASRLVLECGDNGQWNADIPQCVEKTLLDDNGNISNTTTVSPSTTIPYSYEMLPYIVALCILALACIMLIILLSYALLGRRRKRSRSDSSSAIFGGSRSSGGTVNSQTEFWVEMAGTRSFQCHELAQSRDSMVDIVRYTHLHPDWSGY